MSVLATLVDGRPQGAWPADDRALAYGDGLFETIAVRSRRPALLAFHRERLEYGCRVLGLAQPPECLWQEVRELATLPGCSVVKVVWSRGSGRGYRPPVSARGRRLLTAAAVPEYPDAWSRDGVRTRLCRTRLGQQPALAGLKHLSRLEQVLARAEWRDPGVVEGLMQDTSGALVEATQSNLFLVRAGEIETPLLDRAGVAGVVRRLVLERLAPEAGVGVRCARLSLQDLLGCDEIFLTSSLLGVCPVVAVDCWQRPVGPITRRLQKGWRRWRESEG